MVFCHEQRPFLWAISIVKTKLLASKNLSHNWIVHKNKNKKHFQKKVLHHCFFQTHKIAFFFFYLLKIELEPLGLDIDKDINAFYTVFIYKYYKMYSSS